MTANETTVYQSSNKVFMNNYRQYVAFNNEKYQYRIVGYRRPDMTRVTQLRN